MRKRVEHRVKTNFQVHARVSRADYFSRRFGFFNFERLVGRDLNIQIRFTRVFFSSICLILFIIFFF